MARMIMDSPYKPPEAEAAPETAAELERKVRLWQQMGYLAFIVLMSVPAAFGRVFREVTRFLVQGGGIPEDLVPALARGLLFGTCGLVLGVVSIRRYRQVRKRWEAAMATEKSAEAAAMASGGRGGEASQAG